MTHEAFVFETEFTDTGEVVAGSRRSFYPHAEVEEMLQSARGEGANAAQAQGFASLEQFIQKYGQIHSKLVQAADTLRREAAELALIAARQIAGTALDHASEQAAAEAVAEAVKELKAQPRIVVAVAPDAIAAVEAKLEQLRAQGRAGGFTVEAATNAKPGDWRLEWEEGAVTFDRDKIAASIEQAITAHLADPVEEQLDMFSAA